MAIYAIANPTYQPAMRVIAALTNANPAVVTTAVLDVAGVLVPANHNYITGTIVRLNIPTGFGMFQANQLIGTVTVLTPTTFSIDIDTTAFDAFTIPVVWPLNQQQAQVTPVGELNSMLTAAVQNVL